jgi:hypothetical protein
MPLFAAACDDAPTTPSEASVLTFGTPVAAATTLVNAASGFIARGSGQVSIPITASTSRDVPWAQLYVYLLTDDGYCAQNLPDAPTWGPFPKGQTVSVTITGFQVFRTCTVTGIRAMLHQRNSGLLTPPTASETIAEATRQVSWTLLR